MADQYGSFAEFLNDSSRRRRAAAAPPAKLTPAPKINSGQGDAGPPQSFLDWGIDILSRPLYAVTEPLNTALGSADNIASAGRKFQQGDTGGGVGELLALLGEQATASTRGFLSTNRDDKHTTSDLIEQGTDTFGSINDPDYVDEENNVNPILKGVAGFAGDVALDPLTWVPGAQIAKVAQLAGKGLRTATSAGKATGQAVKDVVEARRGGSVVEDLAQVPAKATEEGAELARETENATLLDEFTKTGGVKALDEQPTKPLERRSEDYTATEPAPPQKVTMLVKQKDGSSADFREHVFNSMDEALDFAKKNGIIPEPKTKSGAPDRRYRKVPTYTLREGDVEVPDAAQVVKIAEDTVPAAVEKGPKDYGFPEAEELVTRVQQMVEGLPLNRIGGGNRPTVAGVRSIMKELDADPQIKELLDVELDMGDGEVFAVRSWIDDMIRGDELPENAVQAVQDGLRGLAESGRFADAPKPQQLADEIAPRPATPVVEEVAEELPQSERLAREAGTKMLDMLKSSERLDIQRSTPDVEVPTFDDYVKGMAKAAPEHEAATLGRGNQLLFKDVPKFLAEGSPKSKAYQKVLDQLHVGYEEWVPKYVRHEQDRLPKQKRIKGTPVQRFSKLLFDEDGAAMLELAVGARELANLRKTTDDAQLTRILAELSNVIQKQLDFDTIDREAVKLDTTREFMKRAGLDRDLPLPAPMQGTSNVGEGLTPTEALTRMESPQLDEDGVMAAQVLRGVIEKDFFQRGLPDNLRRPYHTNTGVARTSRTPGEGYAVDERRMNDKEIANLAHQTVLKVTKWVGEQLTSRGKQRFPAGPARAKAVQERYLSVAQLRDDALDREGVQQFLGIKENDLPITDYQIRRILGEESDDTLALLYNVETSIPISNFYDAVAAVMRGADRGTVRDILLTKKPRWGDKEFSNPLAGDGARRFGFYRQIPGGELMKKRTIPGYELPFVANKNGTGFYRIYSADELTEMSLDMLFRNRDNLLSMRNANVKAVRARTDIETGMLTEEGIARLDQLVSDPVQLTNAIRAVSRVDKDMHSAARAAGATSDAETMATQNVRQSSTVDDTVAAQGAAKTADTQERVGTPEAGRKQAQQTHEKLAREVDEQMDSARDAALAKPPAERTELERALAGTAPEMHQTEKTMVQIDKALERVENPVRDRSIFAALGERFKANYGMERVYRFLHGGETASALRRTATIRELQDLVARHGGALKGGQSTIRSSALNVAWNDLRAGVQRSADPAVEAARRDLDIFMSRYFDTTRRDSILGNQFFRTTASVDYVNEELAEVGAKLKNGEPAQFEITKNGSLADVAEQWRLWDVDDPAEFLLKLYTAAERVSTKAIIGQNFVKFAKGAGLRSSEPRPGFVKPQKNTLFTSMLDDGYYDAEILKELHRLEDFTNASRSFKGGVGKFVHGFFDPIQQSWKFGMTVVRPGHHVRNFVGDASMTYLAEGMAYAGQANKDAIKILSTMRNQYDGVDFNRMMEGLGAREVAGSTDVLVGGKYGPITIQQAYDAAFQRGLLNSYRHSEDVLDNGLAPGGFARFMDRISLRGGKVEATVGGISEARDHYARMQHFMQYIHKAQAGKYPKFKSVEDLFDNAAHQVKKYHPDGSMLTPFEAKYMRRMIPFYSWLRGAVPALVESLVLHPARVQVFPKASYNLAVAMGLNPDSLTNPFPEDQLFPSFLTDQVFGPQFEAGDMYLGVNPGFASVDVANQFLAGQPGEATVRGVLGAATPLVRVPLELASGGAWGTGARINDTSDYIDASLPGVNYVANVTGNSVTGSLASILQGRGFDPQLQVDRGNKGPADSGMSILNWFTGLGLQNMSRENFINYAEIEKRDAASDSEESRSAF